ncbi:MAG: Na(+)-translocating NADH-quinone reductase subunit A [Prevotellaceae bacterium]|nr:Na(+)-translocating NADH-quinone reductase subunit A [Prevotellaceae bacterium]MDY3365992.1 Na(+)-translocating NADH-quinone reductase subunit A [Prevotella sp.]
MANVIKLRKGLNINLKGKADETIKSVGTCEEYSLIPGAFTGVVPKVVVHEGDRVKAGDVLFVNKSFPEVKFSSPVSGIVTAVERGDRRRVLGIKVKADETQEYREFGVRNVNELTGKDVVDALLDAGLFGYIYQLPYAISTRPDVLPKAIFVSALRDMPLAGNFSFELKGNENDFQTGLTALSKVANVYLGVGTHQTESALMGARDVTVNVFDGKCPAGNVSVQVSHVAPVNKGEVVWTVDPTFVIFFGRLFNTGRVQLQRTIAVAGSEVESPSYVQALIGTSFAALLKGQVKNADTARIINGNPLTGTLSGMTDYVGTKTSEITVILEGNDADEMFGWIMPRFNQFSASRSYFSWLLGNKEYVLDARIKGGERHLIMSGEYDKVLPMDIYGEYLIKAIIAGDIDKMEQLGIYEVSPEDFALAEFVDSSKLELQRIVREGLDMLCKENS